MGEIVRKNGLILIVRSNDHIPPHVHIFSTDAEVRILLDEQQTVLSVKGKLNNKKVRRARALVREYLTECVRLWEDNHGKITSNI
jgi:hypothetical protein